MLVVGCGQGTGGSFWENPIRPETEEKLVIERILSGHDQDEDGIDDLEDLVLGARQEVENRTTYRSAYYAGGYPPDEEGVCTDLIWRAFQNAGYDLKEMVDRDIQEHLDDYPRVQGKPDPNIDFRRVLNLIPFFKRHGDQLVTEVIPWDEDNLRQWQGGDIVVYGAPLGHIGIVSDRRRADGVPLLIHNGGPYASEEDRLLSWPSELLYHFRFPASQ
ncbi:MAG TPA: DUF1287 domain-containing protein [Clostridia bacterium]|nr:DUF1287 domain-containing protein [Clostridia bacterium]